MSSDGEPRRVFPGGFDDAFQVGPDTGNWAFFGRNVLHGLVDGIDDFVIERQPRWHRYRSLGPTVLASSTLIPHECDVAG